MGLKLGASEDKDYTPIPEGFHHAVCYAVYDLGTQELEWEGEVNTRKEMMIMWELPKVRIEIDKGSEIVVLPKSISRRFNQSLHSASAFRKLLRSWRGKDLSGQELKNKFSVKSLLGANGLAQIIHNTSKTTGKTYARLEMIMPLTEDMNILKPENEPRYFDFDEGGDLPEQTPEWVRDIIAKSPEWQERQFMKEDSFNELNPPPETQEPPWQE